MQKFSHLHLPPYHFAYPLSHLREVIKAPNIRPIPKSPPYIKGLLPMRGHLYTILSLPTLLAFSPKTEEMPYTILINHPQERFGFQVSKVDIINDDAPLKPTPTNIPFAAWTKGVFITRSTEIFILNFQPLFSSNHT